MQNILNAAMTVMKHLVDPQQPKPPLHIGEAMACWTYLAILTETHIYEDAALNTTEDPELHSEVLTAREICQNQIETLRTFMIAEGVPLPPSEESKPKSDPKAIPLGVKVSDDEIANALAFKGTGAIIHCATACAQSVRTDVAIMWTRFQAEQMTYAFSLKKMMSKRGWLKMPPSFMPPGLPSSPQS